MQTHPLSQSIPVKSSRGYQALLLLLAALLLPSLILFSCGGGGGGETEAETEAEHQQQPLPQKTFICGQQAKRTRAIWAE